MSESDVALRAAQVLWAVFFLACAFGAVVQRSHFCTMGAVADIVNMGDWSRMRTWVLAMGVAVVGFQGMAALGWVQASQTIYTPATLTWLSHGLGGALFGFGMVLASGCGSKNLVRAGGGSLKALVVLLVLAVSAYATMRGLFAVWRVHTIDRVAFTLPAGQDLPALAAWASGQTRRATAAWVGIPLGLAMVAWAAWPRRHEGRAATLPGLALGMIVVAVWWVSGVFGHVAEDPRTLEPAFLSTHSRRMESLTYVAPVAYVMDWLILYSDGTRLINLGMASVLGVLAGSAASALIGGTFRWEGFRDAEDTANHLVGGALMGIGGVTAMGCTIGQGLSGMSTLALGSAITLVALIAGAVAGLRYQAWRLDAVMASGA